MQKSILRFDQIPQLAKIDVAYATGDPRLKPFYAHAPTLEGIQAALQQKKGHDFPRTALAGVLEQHYAGLPEQEAVSAGIAALRDPATFTVVTAHQPSLLLGPLYFIYKAISVINLAEQAQARTGTRIVPVFVLGSEDHDLDELNNIHLFGKKLIWESPETGSVGSMGTASLGPVLAELGALLGESEAARALFARVEKAYTAQPTIAAATRAFLHDLLGRFGLVTLDMDHPDMKRHFLPVLRAELFERPSLKLVQKSTEGLNAAGFKTQAMPREINLFYKAPGIRERIVLEDGVFKVLNTDLVFDKEAMSAEVEARPERFSPNVVLRPLYQEMVLPNLAYVGGGGELAYWLERKALFEYFKVPLPVLIRRNSAMWLDKDAVKKIKKSGFGPADFFEDTDVLIRRFVETHAEGEVGLAAEIAELRLIFEKIAQKAAAIDPTLEKAVRADETKAVGGLEQWEGRLMRAEKQKHEVVLNQLRALKEKLCPGGGLQERHDNFMPYLLKYGEAFLDVLKENLDPFDAGFVVLEDNQ
jgi:bacillithiol synthase